MHIGKLLLILVVVHAVFLQVQGRECTEDDYKASYTECSSSNTRDLIYYLKHDVNCSGGFSGHQNVYDLPCGIACAAGSYLPLGEKACSVCPAGKFSIGGGYRIDSWYSLPDLLFTNYSTNSSGAHLAGHGWQLGQTFIRSGNISDSQSSVLEMSVYIASTVGHVSFSYRVNAEGTPTLNWDGLSFQVDRQVVMAKTSHTANYITVTYPLSFGAHVLAWIYSKDATITKGEDAAFINMIEIGGVDYADNDCTECPEGTYNPNINSTKCIPCPANTYSNEKGATTCYPCQSNEYSYSEADGCMERPACNEGDYEQFYSSCDSNGQRTLNYAYITPIICNTVAYQLPSKEEGLPCGTCTDGAFRNSTTYACQYCRDGYYSVDGQLCQACPAGTAGFKTFSLTQFDDWLVGSNTNCSGDCYNQGWLLHSTYMDSGIGHGSNVNSWFQFTTNLTAPGVVNFTFEISCPSLQCSLYFSSGSGEPAVYLPSATPLPVHVSIALASGVHSLNWTFSKYDYTTGRDDAAIIYSINITNAVIGGASTCLPCPSGTISRDGSSTCSPCPPGHESDASRQRCVQCPTGTHNPVQGGLCIPCGNGTVPLADYTGCQVNCTFSPDGSRMFDLNKLKSSDSYGPVKDSSKQDYFINVCSMQPQKCYSDVNTTIESYACQETIGKIPGSEIPLGKDLGHVLGWQTLSVNNSYDNDVGVIMTLEYGDTGCPINGIPRHRNTTIAFLCDPLADIGSPVPLGTSVEHTPCSYSFVWRSLYACPVCNIEVDMDFYYSSCQNGKRTKTYYWRQNPPLCHSGELPATTVVDCHETTTVCAAGQYLVEDKCTQCKAGSFSVGGGERVTSWEVMPTRFSSQCTPSAGCTQWRGDEDGVGTVSSGTGDSRLTASYNFVVAGSVSFFYKVYSPKAGLFNFTIDNQEQLHLVKGINRLEWVKVSINVSKGIHVLEWAFYSGSEATSTTGRAGAVLKDVTVIGTDYHDESCTPCPPGFSSSAGASICTPCEANHFSQGDSPSCLACPTNSTSLATASQCVASPACTGSDVVAVYSECYANNSRTLSYSYLQPQHCVPSKAGLPALQFVDCDTSCVPGAYEDSGSCSVCSSGQYWDGTACTTSMPGQSVVRQKYYFADNKTISLPSTFTTSCSGNCGSSGWRVKNAAVESGYHGSNAVDSLLTLKTKVTGRFTSISFNYNTVSNTGSALSLYVDGEFLASLVGTDQYSVSLTEGAHNITWNYHQHQHTNGYAELSNIIVIGSTEVDAGGKLETCPPGSYSDVGTPCMLCPPGSYADKEGLGECALCEVDTYNPLYGATECLTCNADSYATNKGAQFCESQCQYSAIVDNKNVRFSLAGFGLIGPLEGLNNKFYFDLCNSSLVGAPCDPGTYTHSCAQEDSGAKNWGGYLEFDSSPAPIVSGSKNTTYSVSFSHGDSDGCEPGVQRSIVFNLQCDKYASTMKAVFNSELSSSCKAVFDWAGNVGCPVCEDSDYDTLLGSCVDGMRTVQQIRKTDCNGDPVRVSPSQSCSSTVEFPIVVVFVIIGVILALVAVAVIVFIKNRRITAQYSRLKHQSDGHTVYNEEL